MSQDNGHWTSEGWRVGPAVPEADVRPFRTLIPDMAQKATPRHRTVVALLAVLIALVALDCWLAWRAGDHQRRVREIIEGMQHGDHDR